MTEESKTEGIKELESIITGLTIRSHFSIDDDIQAINEAIEARKKIFQEKAAVIIEELKDAGIYSGLLESGVVSFDEECLLRFIERNWELKIILLPNDFRRQKQEADRNYLKYVVLNKIGEGEDHRWFIDSMPDIQGPELKIFFSLINYHVNDLIIKELQDRNYSVDFLQETADLKN